MLDIIYSMATLLLSGGWLSSEGLYEAKVREVHFLKNIDDLKIQGRGFLLIAYDYGTSTLGVPLKMSPLPRIVYAEIEEVVPYRVNRRLSNPSLELLGFSLSREGFIKGVRKIKDYIAKGDVYQINLSSRLDFRLRGSPLDLFLEFFKRQPVPFGFFFEAEGFFVISGSMELFLKKEGNLLRSSPIKGTGRDPRLLAESPKERAENLMITDMMRNDIGRVAEVGSVKVEELFKVSPYRTLYQMHSTVVGRTDKSLPEIIKATFPPASVTGAPKRRAVEIINELEPHARGYYCGAGGLVDESGNFTLSVLIRTAYGVEDKLSYFAGCGIVWDSDPVKEWEELLLKTRAFYKLKR